MMSRRVPYLRSVAAHGDREVVVGIRITSNVISTASAQEMRPHAAGYISVDSQHGAIVGSMTKTSVLNHSENVRTIASASNVQFGCA